MTRSLPRSSRRSQFWLRRLAVLGVLLSFLLVESDASAGRPLPFCCRYRFACSSFWSEIEILPNGTFTSRFKWTRSPTNPIESSGWWRKSHRRIDELMLSFGPEWFKRKSVPPDAFRITTTGITGVYYEPLMNGAGSKFNRLGTSYLRVD
jgi:hypothetical protein